MVSLALQSECRDFQKHNHRREYNPIGDYFYIKYLREISFEPSPTEMMSTPELISLSSALLMACFLSVNKQKHIIYKKINQQHPVGTSVISAFSRGSTMVLHKLSIPYALLEICKYNWHP